MKTAESIQELPLVGILRACADDRLAGVIESVIQGGMKNLEITMNSPGAERQIREATRLAGGALNIGAGTVTSLDLLEAAVDAGAAFIVTPFLESTIISACVRRDLPVFPGALTPTEIWEAWELGATMVKVFPAELGGETFLRALRGPFPTVKLMPTGGVTLDTLPALMKAGASGFGIGSPLFQKDRLEARDWPWLEREVAAYVQMFQMYGRDAPIIPRPGRGGA